MKKYLPIILFAVGILAFAGIYFFVIRDKSEEIPVEDEEVAEVPFDQRPFMTLTPVEAGDCLPEDQNSGSGTTREQGHCLKMTIEKIVVDAATLDYELLYQDNTDRTLGVPGTINLSDDGPVERDLLLGSASSGKLRFDEGVEGGTISLRFRNDKGKLVGKMTSTFHLQTGSDELTSQDGRFKFTLDDSFEDVYFVVMDTLGIPERAQAPGNVKSGPYGVFASEEDNYSGKVEIEGLAYLLNGSSWDKIEENASNIGVFIGTSE